MSSAHELSGDFSAADESIWVELVEKALRGRSPDSLSSKTEHGLTVRALYRESDWQSATDPSGYPGLSPFVRGGAAGRDEWLAWDIRQIVRHSDLTHAHDQIFEALNGGASSLELVCDPSGLHGVGIRSKADVEVLLDGVKLDLATVALRSDWAQPGFDRALATLVATAIPEDERGLAQIAFNLDPIGAFARTGQANASLHGALQNLGDDTDYLRSKFPAGTVIGVDASLVHEAGGDEIQELAYAAAVGAAYMRAGINAGLSADDTAKSMLFRLAVGGDYHLEIPKLRALRRIWGRIAEAFGADGAVCLQATTSGRMLAKRDPWTNLLRNTSACFAAGVGGADIVTVRTYTDALGHPGSLARRMARNTQIIAQEESGLGRVIDPAGGSWAFETLTEEMAQSAWTVFQQIEGQGGILGALENGAFQAMVAKSCEDRRNAVASRREWVTGVSDFPALAQVPPDIDEVTGATPPPSEQTSLATNGEETAEALMAASIGGATLTRSTEETSEEVAGLAMKSMRLAEAFERLRDRVDTHASDGSPPAVFLAAVGPLADHSARLTYATNFFAAGGIASAGASGSNEELAETFKASGQEIACICGSDAAYDEAAEGLARALKAAGATRVYLAGKPGENRGRMEEAGIDEFIHIGVDVVNALERVHATLGVGAEH